MNLEEEILKMQANSAKIMNTGLTAAFSQFSNISKGLSKEDKAQAQNMMQQVLECAGSGRSMEAMAIIEKYKKGNGK